MYFVIENNIINGNIEIISHVSGSFGNGKLLLDKSVKEYVRKTYGEIAIHNFKINDVSTKVMHITKNDIDKRNPMHLFDIIEPEEFGPHIYRLKMDPNKLYVCVKSQKLAQGYLWGKAYVPYFDLIRIFELKEYDKLTSNEDKLTSVCGLSNEDNIDTDDKCMEQKNSDTNRESLRSSMQTTAQKKCDIKQHDNRDRKFAGVLNDLKASKKFKSMKI
jgi:hypothetical protein